MNQKVRVQSPPGPPIDNRLHEFDNRCVKPDYVTFMEARNRARSARCEQGGFAPHCDGRVLHKPDDCQYCAMSDFVDLHEFRTQNKILYTGEDPKQGWWPCPAEQARGLRSVNSWGGNTAKPEGCKCGWFTDSECPVHP